MKKIVYTFVFIFTIFALGMLLCLPSPIIFAEETQTTENLSTPNYTEIESNLISNFVALDYFGSLYATDGINVIRAGEDEKLIFQHNQTNKFYNLAASFDDVYCSQSSLYVEMYPLDENSPINSITSIDRIWGKDAIEYTRLSENTKKIACDEWGNVFVIVDKTIGVVSVNETSTPITYYLDYITTLADDKTFNGGGFCINEDGDTMYYSIDNTVYRVNITQTEVEVPQPPVSEEDHDTTNPDENIEDATNEENSSQNEPQFEIVTKIDIDTINLNEFKFNSDNSFVTFPNGSTITNLRVDNIGNLYALISFTKEITDSAAIPYTITCASLFKFNLNSKKADKIDYEFQILDIAFDFCTGTTYASINEPQYNSDKEIVTDNLNNIVFFNKLVKLETFGMVTNYLALTQQNYTDFMSRPATKTCVTFAQVSNGAPLYDYSSRKTPKSVCAEDKNLVILGMTEDSRFYYVLDTNFALAPFYKLAYVPIKNVDSTVTPNLGESIESKVIVARARLYNLPSSVILSKTEDSIIYAPHCDIPLLRDQTVCVVTTDFDFPLDHNSTPFVLVSTVINNEEILAYMDKRTLISLSDDNSLKIVHGSNAVMRVDTTVFAEASCETEKDYLSEGDKVTVLSKNHGIAKIQYYIGNEIRQGYVDKNLVDDGSLTTLQFIGLIIALVCVIIAIVVGIIIHAKAKKRNKMNI